MGILDFFRAPPAPTVPAAAPANGPAVMAYSFDDPRLLEFLRAGEEAITGQSINVERALRNPSMFRAVSLISNAIGMLPTHVIDTGTKEKASEHPLFRILHRRPNEFQTAFDFKSLMQMRALTKGDAYALIHPRHAGRRCMVERANASSCRRIASRLAAHIPGYGKAWVARLLAGEVKVHGPS